MISHIREWITIDDETVQCYVAHMHIAKQPLLSICTLFCVSPYACVCPPSFALHLFFNNIHTLTSFTVQRDEIVLTLTHCSFVRWKAWNKERLKKYEILKSILGDRWVSQIVSWEKRKEREAKNKILLTLECTFNAIFHSLLSVRGSRLLSLLLIGTRWNFHLLSLPLSLSPHCSIFREEHDHS